jgi:hypothetical protein
MLVQGAEFDEKMRPCASWRFTGISANRLFRINKLSGGSMNDGALDELAPQAAASL